MQQRFHLSYHDDFLSALAAKKDAIKAQPNTNFQIRKRKVNFELVRRIAAKVETPTAPPVKPLWKKSKNTRRFSMKYNNEQARENGTGKWTGRVKP